MMAELVSYRARSAEIAAVSTSARSVSAGVFIVRHVSLNVIHPTHCIGLRCVVIFIDGLIS
jgi:hypothetical protein